MRFRKLRIAWSVVWGIACLLLFALWVRSYWWTDTLFLPKLNLLAVSMNGYLAAGTLEAEKGDFVWIGRVDSFSAKDSQSAGLEPPSWHHLFMFKIVGDGITIGINVSDWFLAIIAAALAAAPWLPLRHNLLIAIPLAAAWLGMAVCDFSA